MSRQILKYVSDDYLEQFQYLPLLRLPSLSDNLENMYFIKWKWLCIVSLEKIKIEKGFTDVRLDFS